MSNRFKMGTGQAHELAMAFDRNGWDAEDVKMLSEGSCLAEVLKVLRGQADIVPRPVPTGAAGKGPYRGGRSVACGDETVIDCSAEPILPDGWEIRPEDQIASRHTGDLVWTPDAVRLHLDPGQENGHWIRGCDLKKALEGKPVLPANVLDWLCENRGQIPQAWKGRAVYFWGTIYRDRYGVPVVRCLQWSDGRWIWYFNRFGNFWYDSEPAAVPAGVF